MRNVSPKQLEQWFSRKGLVKNRDYVHCSLLPDGLGVPSVRGIEMVGGHWYTYRAEKSAKFSVLRHDNFEKAAWFIVEKVAAESG